ECRRLVAEILRMIPEVPASLVDLIVEKAEGSPFYVEELVNVLIEGGVIVRGDEHWHIELEKLRTVRVPATLTGLLQARLDTLPAGDREILQQASVVGRVFWSNVLERMRNPDQRQAVAEPGVDRSLEALRTKELIFHNEESAFTGSSEYLFKNAVLHDVTYESVLLRLRRVYHIQVAEGLIQLGGERAGESAGRIGEHYEKAEEWLRAAEWYVRAGKRAQETYAPEEAAIYFGKALGFFRKSPTPQTIGLQLEAHERLGEVFIWQARYGEAIGNYKSMLQAATDQGDIIAQSHALLGIAYCLSLQGDHHESMEHAVRAERLAARVGAKAEIAKALWLQGSACYRLSDGQQALNRAEHALAINTELNDRNEMARCVNLLAAAYYSLGRYAESKKYWENALELFQGVGDRRKGMDVLNNLGVVADAGGDYSGAFERYNSALELAREMGYRDGEIVFLTNRGSEQVALGNFAAAEGDLNLALELAGTAGSWILPLTHYYLAEARLRLGKPEQALQAARTALALGRADGAPEYIGAAYRVLGMISKQLGQPLSIDAAETAVPDT
ncbi:MAG TPA: tetratricopeptide repeat protein, partial [Anaerolineales bacterium]